MVVELVKQPVQDRRSKHRISENLTPRTVRLIGRQDDGTFFVPLRYDLEEEMGGGLFHFSIANFINDQQMRFGKLRWSQLSRQNFRRC